MLHCVSWHLQTCGLSVYPANSKNAVYCSGRRCCRDPIPETHLTCMSVMTILIDPMPLENSSQCPKHPHTCNDKPSVRGVSSTTTDDDIKTFRAPREPATETEATHRKHESHRTSVRRTSPRVPSNLRHLTQNASRLLQDSHVQTVAPAIYRASH